MRDGETVPLKEDVGEYFKREVLPHLPDAWYLEPKEDSIGYEIPLARYFYQYTLPRSSEEIKQEISSLNQEIQEMLKAVLNI